MSDVAETIARDRGREWAYRLSTIIIPSSMEWPWSPEAGIKLARKFVYDLADDQPTLDLLAVEVFSSARQHWSRWRDIVSGR